MWQMWFKEETPRKVSCTKKRVQRARNLGIEQKCAVQKSETKKRTNRDLLNLHLLELLAEIPGIQRKNIVNGVKQSK